MVLIQQIGACYFHALYILCGPFEIMYRGSARFLCSKAMTKRNEQKDIDLFNMIIKFPLAFVK